jgi:hypothetical protein
MLSAFLVFANATAGNTLLLFCGRFRVKARNLHPSPLYRSAPNLSASVAAILFNIMAALAYQTDQRVKESSSSSESPILENWNESSTIQSL